ncbi:Magnesium and cobalt transport protein CorA [Entamoeba marina]
MSSPDSDSQDSFIEENDGEIKITISRNVKAVRPRLLQEDKKHIKTESMSTNHNLRNEDFFLPNPKKQSEGVEKCNEQNHFSSDSSDSENVKTEDEIIKKRIRIQNEINQMKADVQLERNFFSAIAEHLLLFLRRVVSSDIKKKSPSKTIISPQKPIQDQEVVLKQPNEIKEETIERTEYLENKEHNSQDSGHESTDADNDEEEIKKPIKKKKKKFRKDERKTPQYSNRTTGLDVEKINKKKDEAIQASSESSSESDEEKKKKKKVPLPQRKFLQIQMKEFDIIRLNTPVLPNHQKNGKSKQKVKRKRQHDDIDINDFFPPNEKVFGYKSNENIWRTTDILGVLGEKVNKGNWNILQKSRKFFFLWVYVENPSNELMVSIGILFDLHQLTIERWLDEDQREEALIYPQYYELLLKDIGFGKGTNVLNVKNTHIVIKKRVIITFHRKDDAILHEILDQINPNKCTAEWILYQILHKTSLNFFNWIDSLKRDTEVMRDLQLEVLKHDQMGYVTRNKILENKVTKVLQCLQRKKGLLGLLVKSSNKKTFQLIQTSFEVMLRDVYYDFRNCYGQLKNIRSQLQYSLRVYYARLTVESTRTERKTTEIIKKFNAATLVFFPLFFIGSLWGINDHVPWQSDVVTDEYPFHFLLIVLGCIIVFIIELLLFKKMKWI